MNEKEQAEQIWSLVTTQPIGFKLRSNEPTALYNLLIEVRLTANNPDLFQFSVQVKGEEVWILRSKALPKVKVSGAFSPLEE